MFGSYHLEPKEEDVAHVYQPGPKASRGWPRIGHIFYHEYGIPVLEHEPVGSCLREIC